MAQSLTKMPSPLTAWAASEPEVGSTIDSLRIETIGHIPNKTDWIHTRFPFYGIGLVLRGQGTWQVNKGLVRPLTAPAVFWIWPEADFSYGPDPGTSWEERYITFTGSRVSEWLRWGWIAAGDRPRGMTKPEALQQMHRRICGAFLPFGEIPLDQAKLELEQYVHEIFRQTNARFQEPDGLSILINQWIKNPLTADGLRESARALGMSYSGFRQQFCRRTGVTPHQFLLRLRIDQACLRLVQTSDPIKAIALDTGFAFVESFNRAFRSVKGISPGEYRRRIDLLAKQS